MSCCSDTVVIHGGYEPLSQRLLNYGKDAYSDVVSRQRVVMWVFVFYDENDQCPTCKQAFSDMFAWFNKYHLFDDPVRCVRTVIEPSALIAAINRAIPARISGLTILFPLNFI